MAKIRIVGDSSGYVELSAPNAAGNNTLELPSNATKLVGADASNSLNVTGIATFSGGIVGNVTGSVNSTGVSTITTLNATSIVGVTTAGITTAYVTSINDGPLSGSKNRIINGDFEIWQRGTSVTFLSGGNAYLADRWSGAPEYQESRHQRVSVTSPIAGMTARYALRASSSTTGEAASGTRIALGQKIENLNCYDLVGKKISLSFYVKFSSASASASSGDYGRWIAYIQFDGTTTDASFNTTSPPTSTSGLVTINNGSLPTTWTKYTSTTTVPSGTNNISVRFGFETLGNTSSADTLYYDITNIQLEEGPVASVFERRSYGQELLLCYRYYQKSTTNEYYQLPSSSATQIQRQKVTFVVPMRTIANVARNKVSGSATIGADGSNFDGFRSGFGGNQYETIDYSWTSSAEL